MTPSALNFLWIFNIEDNLAVFLQKIVFVNVFNNQLAIIYQHSRNSFATEPFTGDLQTNIETEDCI